MKKPIVSVFVLLAASGAFIRSTIAQQFEVGALAGGGLLSSVPVNHAPASVAAGYASGPAAGIVFTHDRYARWSGEIRYLFEQRDPSITSGSNSASFAGQTHAFSYDMVFRFRPRKNRVQPYVSAGGGVKIFRGTGAETAYRPLMEYAYLTRATEWKPLVAVGAGVKIGLSRRWLFRAELQNYITPFPEKVITPAPGLSMGGWLMDFVPTVGLSWLF